MLELIYMYINNIGFIVEGCVYFYGVICTVCHSKKSFVVGSNKSDSFMSLVIGM